MIKLIVAMTPEKLIGKNNKMPWHISAEFAHFKNTTMGHSLLFGRTTFEALPKKLTGRKIYVLSSSKNIVSADETISNEAELIELFKKYKDSKEILFIAGGKSIYEKFCDYADEWIVSYIWGEYSGNIYLDLSFKNHEKVAVDARDGFDIVTYKKIK